MTDYPTLNLNDGRQIPQLGFGTWQMEEEDAPQAVSTRSSKLRLNGAWIERRLATPCD